MTLSRFKRALAAGTAILVLGGCHWDMWDDARLKPYEPTGFFDNGMSAREPVVGTIPYGSPMVDEHFSTGRVGGQFVDALPARIALDRELLERGQARYNIYCIVCHGSTGEGNGMIVQRGFPKPTSYHIDRLREADLGYFFDVMTNGFGRMYSYAARIPIEDRWAIAAYIRALQLSQNATPDLVPEDVIGMAQNPPAAGDQDDAAHGGATTEDNH